MPDKPSFFDLVDSVKRDAEVSSALSKIRLNTVSFTESDFGKQLGQVTESYQTDPNAWVTNLEAEEELTGALKNLGASVVSGASRVIGDVAALPSSISAARLANVPDAQLEAYEMIKQRDQYGAEDSPAMKEAEALLNQKVNPYTAGNVTWKDIIEGSLEGREHAKEINEFFDISGIVNQTNRKELDKAIGATFDNAMTNIKAGQTKWSQGDKIQGALDIAEGATELLFGGATDLAGNPVATAEYIAENVPQLATGVLKGGKVLLAASNLGYAGDIYVDAVTEYEKEKGVLPTQAELREMLAWSASAAVAEQVGDVATLKTILKSGKVSKEAQSKLRQAISGTGAIASTALKEGLTEGYQTAVEENLSKLDEELDWKKIYTGAVIGAGSGAGLAATGKAAVSAGEKAAKQVAETAQANRVEEVKKATIAEAVETGDISKVEDPIAKAEAVVKINAKEDIAQEEKESNLQEIDTLVQEEQSNQLATMEKLATLLESTTEEVTDEQRAEIKNLESELKLSDDRLNRLNELKSGAATNTIDITKDLPKAIEGDAESAQRVFGSYRIDPKSLSEEQAIQLAEADNGLDANQKAELKNFAALEKVIKTAGEVNRDIIVGNVGSKLKAGERTFWGIQNYRDYINQAVNEGNIEDAQSKMNILNAFVDSQQTKLTGLNAVVEALRAKQPVTQAMKDTLAPFGITKFTGAIAGLQRTVQKEVDLLVEAQTLLQERINIPSQEVVSETVPDTQYTDKQTVPVQEQPEPQQVQDIADVGVVAEPTVTEEVPVAVINKQAINIKSTVSNRVTTYEGYTVNLGYEGLDNLAVYYKERLGWRVKDLSSGKELPKYFASENEALDYLQNEANLNKLALTFDSEAYFNREKEYTRLLRQQMKTSMRGQAIALKVISAGWDWYIGRITTQEMENIVDKYGIDMKTNEAEYAELVNIIKDFKLKPKVIGTAQPVIPKTTSKTNIPEEVKPEYVPTTTDGKYSLADEVLKQPNDAEAPLNQQNLLVKDFTKGSNTSALDSTPKFIESAKANPEILNQYVDELNRPKAKEAMEGLLEFYDKVGPILDVMFKPKKEGYKHQDYVQYLAVDGVLPDNVKLAIALGAYDWLTNSAAKSVFNSDDAIRSMLGLTEDAVIPRQLGDALRSGLPQSVIVQEMGQSAAASLNLRPKKNAMMNQQEMLNNSLGVYSFKLLQELGWFEAPVRFSNQELTGMLGGAKHSVPDTIRIMPLKSSGFRPIAEIDRFIEKSKKYPGLTRDLFSTQFDRPKPTFKPTKVSSKVKKSFMQVPRRTREILDKVNGWKWNFNNAFSIYNQLDPVTQKAIMGYDFNPEKSMKVLQGGIISKNNAIEREIADLVDFGSGLGDKPFFLSWEVWKNQRMGIKNSVNPQTSKLHRFMIGLDNWKTEIDPTNPVQYNKYLVTVAGGFGLAPEKVSEYATVQKFKDNILTNEVIMDGVDALVEFKKGVDPDTEQELNERIAAAVKEGGHNAHTFQALVALADERIAAGGKFSYQMFREVDGITNGVNITTIQFPDADEALFDKKMQRQGIYNDATKGFADWKTQEAPDSYEAIATKWQEALSATGVELSSSYLAFRNLIGDIVRDTAKSPLMTTIYGAGIEGVIDGAGNIALDKLYSNIQKALEDNDGIALQQQFNILNQVSGSKHVVKDVENFFEEYKNFELSKREVSNFLKEFAAVYQPSLQQALDAEYGDLFAMRDKFNSAINIAGAVFIEHYNAKVQEVKDSTPNWVEGLSEITLEQHNAILKELSSAMPVIATIMSGKDFNAGVSLMKTERTPAFTGELNKDGTPKRDRAYKVETSFSGLKSSSSGSQDGRKLSFGLPGVGSIPIAVQSLDASNMVRSFAISQPFLNVHDAECVGDADAYSNPQKLNYAHYKNMQQVSLPKEFADMFDRVMSSATPDMLARVTANPELQQFFKKLETNDLTVIGSILRNDAETLTNRKLERLEKVTYAGQYYLGEQSGFNPQDKSKETLEKAVREDAKQVFEKATNKPKTTGEQAVSLGSSPDQAIKDQYVFEEALEINRENITNVFDSMAHLGTKVDSAVHTEHLRGVITNMVSKVLEPINLYMNNAVGEETKGMITGTDMYIVNQDASIAHSQVLTRVSMSSQEVLAHELVHAITRTGVDNNITARRDLNRLWLEAKASITPAMLANSNDPVEIAAATELWKHMFEPKLVNGRSNHLHEFVALGMTNEPFRNLLAGITPKPIKTTWFVGDNLLEKLSSFFSHLLDWVNGRYFTGTGKGISGDKQLDALVRHIATIESNNKSLLISSLDKAIAPMSMVGNHATRFVKNQVTKAIESKFVTKNRLIAVRVGGSAIKMMVDSKFARFVGETLDRKTAGIRSTENAFINEANALITEAKGRTDKNAFLHDLKRIGTSAIDRARSNIRSSVVSYLNAQFDPSIKLTQEQKSALTYGVLKTDFNVLVATYGMERAVAMLADETTVKNAIKELETELNDKFYSLQAKNLGKFMATGFSSIENGLLNAYNISRKAGTKLDVPVNAKDMEPKIDTLASLYALQFSDKNKLQEASTIALHELSRGEANGFTALVYTLDKVRKDSSEKLFADNPELMIKGYIADHTNPNIGLRIGTASEEIQMSKAGYIKGPALDKDSTDPTQPTMHIYVNKYGGQQAYLAGTTYLMSNKRRGTDLMDLQINASEGYDVNVYRENLDQMVKSKDVKAAAEYASGKLSKGTKMIPVVNGAGKIVGYRYVMADKTKDTLLDRDTAFDKVLGIMAGDVSAKPAIKEQNQKVVDALYADYREDYANNPEQFVTLSLDSGNARHAEIWQMLPYEMKQYVKEVWGRESMLVKREHIDLMFGYRKHSATDKWKKDPELRNMYDKAFIWTATAFFGDKAVMRLRQSEDFIQELVKLGKDTIVIKSFVVTFNNTLSNLFLLSVMGINPVTAMKDYTIAYRAAQNYKRQAKELTELELSLNNPNLSTTKRNLVEQQIAKITEDLASNPVKDLIAQGVLQNIVEDVEISADDFSFKRGLIDTISKKLEDTKVGAVAKGTPNWLKSVGSNALVLQGSGLYQVLQDMAQLSDFGARYALVKHLQSKKKMSLQDAVGKAMQVFIDYDLPAGIGMQYANDMGMVMFSKYLVRVQKVIYETFKANPAGVLSVIALQDYFGFGANIHESLIGVTNPLSRMSTPLDIAAMLDESITINTASNLM